MTLRNESPLLSLNRASVFMDAMDQANRASQQAEARRHTRAPRSGKSAPRFARSPLVFQGSFGMTLVACLMGAGLIAAWVA